MKRTILKYSMFVILGITIITVIAFLVVFTIDTKEANDISRKEQLSLICNANNEIISTRINESIDAIKAAGSYVATFDNIQSTDALQYAHIQSDEFGFERICIVKDNKSMFYGGNPFDISDYEFITEAQEDKTIVSNFFTSIVDNILSISVACPLIKNDECVGVIYGVLHASELYNYLGFNDELGDHYLININKDKLEYGQIVAHPNEQNILLFEDENNFINAFNSYIEDEEKEKYLENCINNGTNGYTTIEYNGEEYYIAFEKTNANNEWYIFTILSESDINAYLYPSNHAHNKIIVSMSICFSLFILVIVTLFIINQLALIESKNDIILSGERLKLAINFEKNIIFDYDFNTRSIGYYSKEFVKFDPKQVNGNLPEALFKLNIIDQTSIGEFYRFYNELSAGDHATCELLINGVGGSEWHQLTGYNKIINDKHYTTCILCDITDQKETQNFVKQEIEYRKALSEKSMFSFDIDLDKRRVINGSPSFMKTYNDLKELNYEQAFDILAQRVIHEEDREKFINFFSQSYLYNQFRCGTDYLELEYRYNIGNNVFRWVKASVHMIKDIVTKHRTIYVLVDDINEMKESTRKLQNKAEIDELTQLPNRSKIVSLVNEYIINMEEGKLAAFIILDLDNFKMVNDTYGHMAGDTVLKEIGAHIRKKIKAADYIGRLGGDEFIVLLKDFKNEEDLYAKCKRLNELFSLDFTFNGVTFTQRCSIGVTIINKKDTNFDELYELSDKALYNSKKIGKANYTIAE